jgi:hypothetical protein
VTYDVRCLIVTGLAWIRHADGPERAVWLATFEGSPAAQKRIVETLPAALEEGEVGSLTWSVEIEALASAHRVPPRLLRPFASTQFELVPAVLVSGRIGDREIVRAPGHVGHVWGRRHADRWRLAHANLPDGRWADLLTAKVKGLPELSLWATHDGSGFGRGGLVVGEGDPAAFVGVSYTDPDGSSRICYHTEAAQLSGRGFESVTAVLEIGTRDGIEGWPVSI